MIIAALEAFAKAKSDFAVITLTAEDALHICRHMSFKRQRNIDIKHVANLTDDLEHEEWIGMSMLLFGTFRRKLKLLDGQHRLMSHAEHGRRCEAPVPRKYVVQRVHGDAAFAYSRLDSRQKKRPSHVAAHALDLNVPAVLAPSAIDAAAAATRYRAQAPRKVDIGDSRTIIDQPYRDSLAYIDSRLDAFNALGPAFENLTPYDRRVRNALLSKGVLPICVETVISTGEKAVRFWRAVLCGENADKATRYIRERMLLPLRHHHSRKTGHERAFTAAIGWNAHITGAISKPRGKTLALKETDLIIG